MVAYPQCLEHQFEEFRSKLYENVHTEPEPGPGPSPISHTLIPTLFTEGTKYRFGLTEPRKKGWLRRVRTREEDAHSETTEYPHHRGNGGPAIWPGVHSENVTSCDFVVRGKVG